MRTTPFVSHLYTKNGHFTKTGSGQTSGNVEARGVSRRDLLAVVVALGVVSAGGLVFNRYRRKTLVQRARRLQELAAEYGKAALRERMGDILMPESWDRDETADSTDGTGYALKVELSPTDDEYWDVHEKLTAQTECGYGAMDGGGESIAGGGGDPDPDGNGAWLSEVHRIQNPYLYTYATLRICIALHCIALHCIALHAPTKRFFFNQESPCRSAREHFDLGLECELLRNVATYGTYLVNRLPDLLLLRRRYYMFHKDRIAALEVRTNAFWGYAKNDLC